MKPGNRMEQKRQAERHIKAPGATTAKCDWMTVDRAVLIDCLATVSQSGGALRLGYTRDGGAYAIGIYGDGDPYTLYVRPSESLTETLIAITDGFTSAARIDPVGARG